MSIGVGHRALADAAIPPHHLPGVEVERREDRVIGPVHRAVHEHDAAVVVLHLAREVDLLHPHFLAAGAQTEQPAASTIR